MKYSFSSTLGLCHKFPEFVRWFHVLTICGFVLNPCAVKAWKLDPKAYTTPWAQQVTPENVLPEYPRPSMTRTDWLNLNGLWQLSITFGTNAASFTNQILVPFPVESSLAGTRHVLSEMDHLWYRRTFLIPPEWQNQHVLLHFEAVDWEAEVWLNGHELGIHRGGYDRFTFDITAALRPSKEQELIVAVRNPIDAGSEPRGKQMLRPRPPFFHSSSGIWQTVWLEPVASTSVQALKLIPDVDTGVLNLEITCRGKTNAVTAEVAAFADNKEVSHIKSPIGKICSLPIPQARTWSPTDPFLYDLKISLWQNGRKIDEVGSYFGMRKISVVKGTDGYPRLYLNNKPLFELGVLDQGYWPDGIYTAPSDNALRADAELIKLLGFNMCRNHVKVEPERWYYWCDKLGILVWQDMPNGDQPATTQMREINKDPKAAIQFERELRQMIVGRGNHPCIVMWIPFNQGWGQYDTVRITKLIKDLDPSRLVADVSGWNDFGVGDVRSLHRYPGPAPTEPDGRRACVMGECGGLGLGVPGHLWGVMTYWNTTVFNSADELARGYESLLARIQLQEEKAGLAGAVVTELTDVESEDDGFVTYDREVLKIPAERVNAANQKVLKAPNVK